MSTVGNLESEEDTENEPRERSGSLKFLLCNIEASGLETLNEGELLKDL